MSCQSHRERRLQASIKLVWEDQGLQCLHRQVLQDMYHMFMVEQDGQEVKPLIFRPPSPAALMIVARRQVRMCRFPWVMPWCRGLASLYVNDKCTRP